MSDLEALLPTEPTLRIGRNRTTHRPRVLIEEQLVVIRTRCGLDPTAKGFTETYAVVTCDDCDAATPPTDPERRTAC